MKKMLLLVSMISIPFGFLCGGEGINEVSDALVLKVKLQGKFKDNSKKLFLLNAAQIVKIGNVLSDVVRAQNQPFFAVDIIKEENTNQIKCTKHENCFLEKKQIDDLYFHYKIHVTHLPIDYLKDNKSDCVQFLPHDAEIYATENFKRGSDQQYHGFKLLLKMDSDCIGNTTLTDYIDCFVKNPSYCKNTEQELLEYGILAKKDGNIVHGNASFFAIENQKKDLEHWQTQANNALVDCAKYCEKRTDTENQQQLTIEQLNKEIEQHSIFYSRFKKCSFASLLVILLAYVTYTKLYVTP